MRTIGTRAEKPSWDFPVTCTYCGVPWPRHRMFLDTSGNWTCPDDADGRDVRTLDELNAMHARSRRGPLARGDGVLIDQAYDRIFDETFDESFA